VATYTAITDVGDTIVELLRDNMGDVVDDREQIVLGSPDGVSTGGNVRLTVFLYDVSENTHARNDERPRIDETTEAEYPLVLDLRYLLTAYPAKDNQSPGGGDGPSQTPDQHSVLGRAMQTLHDNSIVEGSRLEGSLDDELQLSIEPVSGDEVMNIWSTFSGEPFRPSVSYLATPVVIDSTREREISRIVERTVGAYAWRQEGLDE
jgi:hypothetical protein